MTQPIIELDGDHHRRVADHYDVDTEFYRLWLDDSLSYSCALWTDGGDELGAAQRRKLDFFLDHLSAAPERDGGRHLLDIGCGWGAMLERAVTGHGFETATGLTLSASQVDEVARRGLDGVRARREAWQDHRFERTYDAIVSVGAFEHFAPAGATTVERRAEYERFFAAMWSALEPSGRLGLQTIANDGARMAGREAEVPVGRYFRDDVFGGASLPRLTDVLVAADPWFSPLVVRIDGSDYARTCRAWRRRLRSAEAPAREVVGDERYEAYVRYLGVAQKTFELSWCTLVRVVFRRRPRPMTDEDDGGGGSC
jgi:cyclopropane-fatty-acyl-phospholipid synthase